MTDKERLVQLLQAFGFTETKDLPVVGHVYMQDETQIVLGSGSAMDGSFCDFEFDAGGRFISHAVLAF
jgi:hypothetical protein